MNHQAEPQSLSQADFEDAHWNVYIQTSKGFEFAEKLKGKVSVQRFKGLGEMNHMQLRETTIHPDTRRLVQLTLEGGDQSTRLMDMLLAKKRAPDRRAWLQEKGDLAEV